MRWRTLLLTIAATGGGFLTMEADARAGLIVESADHGVPWVRQGMAPPAAAGEPAEEPSRPLPPDPPVFDHVVQQFAHSASGSMSSQPVDGPSGSSPLAALVAPALSGHAQLVAWLGPEGRVWLPPPFSSGIFRPPRSVA